jgi:drug/metabolite transporter (DMT)-like permease
MGLGLLFLSIGARLIPAAEVALITLLEVVLAPLWVWVSISERPAPTAIVGGAVVVVAVVLQTTQKTRSLVTPHPIAAPEAAR